MTRRSLALTALALTAALATRPATAHGASKGLHLHLDPDRAAPEDEVTVAADCAEPMAEIRFAFTGEEPFRVVPEPPAPKRIVAKLPVPASAKGEATNVHAEARGVSGKTYRASAILVLRPRPSPSPPPRP